MKQGNNTDKWLSVVLGLLALAIIAHVLYRYPQPGVADQGDFTRVMCVSGLELKAENVNDPNFVRFLNYTVTDYQIADATSGQLFRRLGATSIAYLITIISFLCDAFGQDTFKTGYLATAYVIIYSIAIYIIYKGLRISNKVKLVGFALLAFFVLLDGNYLVWFNSLYGEPMMITTLTLYTASWIHYIYHRHTLKSERIFIRIVFIFIAAILFLGSKIQVAYMMPVVLIMLSRLWAENKHLLKQYQVWLVSFLYVFVTIYPVGLIIMDKPISRDRQYNSVFYGVLNGSPNPTQDLIDMGLNPDMAVDAGKHSYLPVEEYVRYVPYSQITRDEFYSKMSNAKLVKYYITHPDRLFQGIEYTARQAFITSTLLGKYDSKYSEEPIREFKRFTLWSNFRELHLPRQLWFIIAAYALALIVSLGIYKKNRGFEDVKAQIRLLWAVMLIGLIQFPMPFVGNGQADTSKQLYLFNFSFDLLLLVSVCWCLHKIVDYRALKELNFRRVPCLERE